MRNRTEQQRFRRELLKRDGHRCRECGATADLRACHLVPLADGGTYELSNGLIRCKACDQATDRYAR